MRLLLTCEHGGNRVPPEHRARFLGREDLLASHRGWDPGALVLARHLASELAAPLLSSDVTRLVADLNRSPGAEDVHHDLLRGLGEAESEEILRLHHAPHRAAVRRAVEEAVTAGEAVLHVAVHSFTPVLDGVARETDLAFLFDPARQAETAFVARWEATVRSRRPDLRVRRNFPYAGTDDGLTTTLRGLFDAHAYLGIELEASQEIVAAPAETWAWYRELVTASLRETLSTR